MFKKFFDNRWIKQVEQNKRKVSIAETFSVSASGDGVHIMGHGRLEKDDAIALRMNSGRLGVFRVMRSKSYADFGGCCFDADAKFVERYYLPPGMKR